MKLVDTRLLVQPPAQSDGASFVHRILTHGKLDFTDLKGVELLSGSPETIAGVPLGLSRDLPRLPETGSYWSARCPQCSDVFSAIWRRLPDGCLVIPAYCESCREEQRARWLAENPPAGVPAAIVHCPSRLSWWQRLLAFAGLGKLVQP